MQGVTLTIIVILSILVLTLRPHHALVVYITGLLWYPSFLAISIDTVDIIASRAVVTVLLLRCLSDEQIRRKFKITKLDKWVAFNLLVSIGIVLLTRPTLLSIENRGGFLLDTGFAYMIGRYIIVDRKTLISVVKCISIVLIPLAILGCIEAVTDWQPFVPLRRFNPWNPEFNITNVGSRWGFTRAIGPFNHPILFGSVFAIFLPLVYHLRYERDNWKTWAYILSAIMILGVLSSMSSGPWVMLMVIIFCLIMERFKQWLKPTIYFFILLCIIAEIISNRALYYVVASYANMLGGAGTHRARLIDVAIKHFSQWWLAGCGGKDPGWGHYFGMGHTDVTNEYILAGVKYGILGVIALCGVLIVAFRGLISSHKKATNPVMKSFYWSLGTILFSVAVVWTSIGFFGQLIPLFYCILGIIGSCSLFPIIQKVNCRKVLIDNSGKRIVRKTIKQL